jgi:hypothetical protein
MALNVGDIENASMRFSGYVCHLVAQAGWRVQGCQLRRLNSQRVAQLSYAMPGLYEARLIRGQAVIMPGGTVQSGLANVDANQEAFREIKEVWLA